jgi:hypothetical protein
MTLELVADTGAGAMQQDAVVAVAHAHDRARLVRIEPEHVA